MFLLLFGMYVGQNVYAYLFATSESRVWFALGLMTTISLLIAPTIAGFVGLTLRRMFNKKALVELSESRNSTKHLYLLLGITLIFPQFANAKCNESDALMAVRKSTEDYCTRENGCTFKSLWNVNSLPSAYNPDKEWSVVTTRNQTFSDGKKSDGVPTPSVIVYVSSSCQVTFVKSNSKEQGLKEWQLGISNAGAGSASSSGANPYEFALKNMDGEVSGLTRFYIDVNDDGRADLFITGTSMLGNAGAPFQVFLSTEKGYKNLGEVFLDNETFQILSEKHGGIHDIKVCSHLSASSCVLRTYSFDGDHYRKVSERTIAGADFKKEISSPMKVIYEKSGKQSNWISNNEAVLIGTLRKGADFKMKLTEDLEFAIEGNGPWTFSLHHKKSPAADLIYIVNPPYRFSSHLTIGEGYDESARTSVINTPREFVFLYREQDASKALNLIEDVLRPKSDKDQENATEILSKLPKGRGHLELLSAEFKPRAKSEKSAFDETIENLNFRINLSWPKGPDIK